MKFFAVLCACLIMSAGYAAQRQGAIVHKELLQAYEALPALADDELPQVVPWTGPQVPVGGIVSMPGRVLVRGRILKGSGTPLEVIACTAAGKSHESLVGLELTNMRRLAHAYEGAFGTIYGRFADPERADGHPQGVALDIRLVWLDKVQGSMVSLPVSSLFKDNRSGRQLPNVPFVYATFDGPGPSAGGEKQRVSRTLPVKGSAISLFHDKQALSWSALPGSHLDDRLSVDVQLRPAVGTQVLLDIRRVEAPLSVDALGTKGDQTDRIQHAFKPLRSDACRFMAVSLRGADGADRAEMINKALIRCLNASRRAHIWSVPVLLPAAHRPLISDVVQSRTRVETRSGQVDGF